MFNNLLSRKGVRVGEALICSTCWFLWCKYFHHGQFQATSLKSLMWRHNWRCEEMCTIILQLQTPLILGKFHVLTVMGSSPCLFVDSFNISSGLDHVTCFQSWEISKHDTSRGLESTCAVFGAFLLGMLHHVKKAGIVCCRMNGHLEICGPANSQHQLPDKWVRSS